MTTPSTTPQAPVDHAHVADLEACLDLINTIELTDGVPEDHIPTIEDAIGWFGSRSLAHEDALRTQARRDPDAWLARVRDTRQALREVWDSTVEGRSADPHAVAVVNEALRHGSQPELRATLAGVVVSHRHEPADPTGEALALVVEPLVDSIAEGETDRFRICANDGCRWVFEDTSRGGRRRWCDMTTCGNRAKVRRYRSRRRTDGTDNPEAPAAAPGA